MHLLPGYDCLIYHDDSVPQGMLDKLSEYPCVKLIKMPTSIGRSGCFWRYLAYDEYDLCLFRDIDIAIEENDRFILDHFQLSERDLFWAFIVHARKAQLGQGFVMGGIWGIKKNAHIISMQKLIDDWTSQDVYGQDEIFLSHVIWKQQPSVAYYEPCPIVKNAVRVPIAHQQETYVELPCDYKLGAYNKDYPSL